MRYIKQDNADLMTNLLNEHYGFDIPTNSKITYSPCGKNQQTDGKWCWWYESGDFGSCEHFADVISHIKQHKPIKCDSNGNITLCRMFLAF